ncbi:MAG: hypothetical protein ACE5H9_09095 [Anaerolineae bacterium]
MLPTKIVVIGAGSASFGLNTLTALLASHKLRGSQLALVDSNADSLAAVTSLAHRLNREWQADMQITSHPHHSEALDNAEFVVNSLEVQPREALWRMDYEIPLKYGVRQPYAENGGPGGFAHAARNIGPVIDIVRAMERQCPEAWFINYTNPMIRICDAVHRYSSIRVVGLCHQIHAGYAIVGQVLASDLGLERIPEFTSTNADPNVYPYSNQMARQAHQVLDIKSAGLNHFIWMLDVRDRRTGQDMYPLFAERLAAYDPAFEPLSRRVFELFGLFPLPGDSHLGEYLPWMSDPRTRPWEAFNLYLYEWEARAEDRQRKLERIREMGRGSASIDHLHGADSEGALEIIENIAGASVHYHLAVNIPNDGLIGNLPSDAIVEVPAVFSGAGIQGLAMGELPGPIAELLRREVTVAQLGVDAAITGDRQAALQCLLLDPVITDIDLARRILDDYLEAYREHLPQFWR